MRNSDPKSSQIDSLERRASMPLPRNCPHHLILTAVVVIFAALFDFSTAFAREVPFQGSIEGAFIARPTAEAGILESVAHAAGRATHVGTFTKVTRDAVNLATGAVAGSFTITAPNGDLLNGTYEGLLFFGLVPGTFSWELRATFTGGTGRFVHASGDFLFIAAGDFVVVDGVAYGEYTETFEGTIDY